MNMHLIEIAVTIVVSVLGSSGLWAYISKKNEMKDAKNQMLLGLGHDRIISLGEKYLKRGWITHDEFENLHEYLYKPYRDMGGNGTAEKIVDDIKKLPFKENGYAEG